MKKFSVFFVFITVLFVLWGCAKKQAPIIEPPLTINNQTKIGHIVTPPKVQTKLPETNATVFPNATISALNLPTENSTKVFKEEKVKKSKQTNLKKVSKTNIWDYWRKYGRSTPPLLAIFFDFNKYTIRSDMWDRIKKNVIYLSMHPKIKIELQGNCDERGTNEYNLALGAKRALEVKKVLVALGINKNRIYTVSFGEERPLAKCHNETCWAINRRVDFVVIK